MATSVLHRAVVPHVNPTCCRARRSVSGWMRIDNSREWRQTCLRAWSRERRTSSTSWSWEPGRAATRARCAPPSSASASRSSRRTRSAAPACTSAASPPRRCCTRPRSPTRARESEKFGVRATLDGIDMPAVNAYKDGVVEPAVQGPDRPDQGTRDHRHRGHRPAHRPRGPSRSTARRTSGKAVVLASGSYSRSLPGLEVDGERVLTSEQALRLDRVPRVGGRARRRRDRLRVRERVALLRGRGHDHRGAAPPRCRWRTSSRRRRSSAPSASARSPSPPAPASSR